MSEKNKFRKNLLFIYCSGVYLACLKRGEGFSSGDASFARRYLWVMPIFCIVSLFIVATEADPTARLVFSFFGVVSLVAASSIFVMLIGYRQADRDSGK